MNPELQCIEIVKEMGWTDVEWYTPPPVCDCDLGMQEFSPFVRGHPPGETIWCELPDFVRWISQAIWFSQHMATRGWRCVANMGLDGTWECFFSREDSDSIVPGHLDHYSAGPSLAQAICEAGLRALGKWVDDMENVQSQPQGYEEK